MGKRALRMCRETPQDDFKFCFSEECHREQIPLPATLDGATNQPAPETRVANAGEFAVIWNTSTPEEREHIVDVINARAEQALACVVGDHEAAVTALSTPPTDDLRELIDHLNGLMDSLDESVSHDQVYEQLRVAWNMALALRPGVATPPADNVREALFDVLDQHQPSNEDYCGCGAGYGPAHLTAALLGDRDEFGVLDVPTFEIVPRGTVTDPVAWSFHRVDGSLKEVSTDRERAADSIALGADVRPLFEVRPRGTVTPAEVEAAWRSLPQRRGEVSLGIMRTALEAAREVEK